MSAQFTGLTTIAGRYAVALFDLADADKAHDKVAADLTGLKELIAQSADLRRLILSPAMRRSDQERAMAEILARAGVSDLTRRFVLVVARNRRLFVLPQMIDAFQAELARRRGEIAAEVTAPKTLSARQLAALDQTLQKVMGGKVRVDLKIDPSLLGGLVVKIGSRMVDSSLRTKLMKLEVAMKGTA